MLQMTKRIIHALMLLCLATLASGQQADSMPFRAYIINNEYQVYMRINLHDQNIQIPGQELYGPLPGYLGKQYNSFCWVITSCSIKNEHEAELQLINDFGSEDLKATLIRQNDTLYTLRQGSGSTIKVPHQGKWRKLPKTLDFIKRK